MASGPRKFLIVDDHAAFRKTIRAFLPAGTVTECSDGRDVLACYSAEQPDWVLMDIEMENVDGLAATRQLKQRYPQARVVFVTQYNDAEVRAAARALGAAGFVVKDHLEELRKIIDEAEHGL